MTENYKLSPMSEAEIMNLEAKIYERLCGNQLTGEVAAWLSIVHSHMLRLSNRVAELEKVNPND